jgi:hypothetical protein
MHRFTRLILLLALWGTRATPAPAVLPPLHPYSLECESAVNPLGVDSPQPRLSWKLEGDGYDRRQTAYRIVVQSPASGTVPGLIELWDSGKVTSDDTLLIPYGGRPLRSSQAVHWRVKVWDENDVESDWSEPATWTMGVLSTQDWEGAQWITDAELLRHQRQALGYRSLDAASRDDTKWVQLDLGTAHPVDEVILRAVRYEVTERLGFPRRFKVELARQSDFSDARVIADYSTNDFSNAWASRIDLKGDGQPAQFVRVTANRLRNSDGVICLAFSQIEVVSHGRNVASGAVVTASDSLEQLPWSAAAMVDGRDSREAKPLANRTLRLRREFKVRPTLRRATAQVSGLGHYELAINGQQVGDAFLKPAWSRYDQTVFYDTYDVTALLSTGDNAIGVTLAGGFYNVQGGRYIKLTTLFRPLSAFGLLRLEYEDGSVKTIVTDSQWQVVEGPITFCNMYGGEDYDARLEHAGWDQAGFNASPWREAVITRGPGGTLWSSGTASPPIREQGVLKPLAFHPTPSGGTTYDFGQNAPLTIRLRVRGPAGSQVKIIPAELIREDGSVNRSSCGGGEASWNYTLAGDGEAEQWAPRFFYHGARYLEVRPSPASEGGPLPVVESIEGVIVHSDSAPAGDFQCSSDLFNRTRELIRWAQRGNLAHVITDCPHRERLGWLEQYHLHGPSLRYEWNLDRLYRKTLQDMADAQTATGLVPCIAPEYVVFAGGFRDSPEWGSASVLVPWQQYEWTGDLEPLRQQFAGMKRYVAYLGSKATNHIVSHGLGDWYDLGPNPPGYAQLTPMALTATAFYFQNAAVLARAADDLGSQDDAERYRRLAGEIRAAFNARFFDAEQAVYATGSQTANAIPLVMGLVPESQRSAVLASLVNEIRNRNNTHTTGDVGHRYLLRALADGGRSEVVFDIHSQTDKPGYGFILNQGATSLTEAWDARAGSSQNHFMLGHITEWFYHDVAGIQPDPAAPGFKHILIRPTVVGDLTWAKGRYESVRGLIRSEWRVEGGRFRLNVQIPPNTTATVFVPGANARLVEPGLGSPGAAGVQRNVSGGGFTAFTLGSGDYRFEAIWPASAR